MSKPIRIPITNIFDGSDYTARILVGSNQTPANVILDTGSSNLAVNPSAYDGTRDRHLKPTKYVQLVTYGTGGWAGPMVTTSLKLGVKGDAVYLEKAPIALADVQQRGSFDGVDGILGLAYNSLNSAIDFTPLLAAHSIQPAVTHPWPFSSRSFGAWAKKFGQALANLDQIQIPPYFDELEEKGTIANKFAFYTLRSWISVRHQRKAEIARDPLNQGFFILGGGEEQTDLYQGGFLTVDVVHDRYYNTRLKAFQVGSCAPVPALPLQAKYRKDHISNSIIDSGTSDLTLAADVFDGILKALNRLNPKFTALIRAARSKHRADAAALNLPAWPDLHFILAGERGEDIRLTCTPRTYWQVDFPAAGRAAFQLSGPLGEAHQSILGLPLLNNYYTVFDRSAHSHGVVRFAPIKGR